MKIRCANCGAEIGLERDETFLVCPYCNSSLFLGGSKAFKHFLMPPVVSATGAKDALAKALGEREIPPVDVTGVERLLLGYWGVRGEALQETVAAFSPVPQALVDYVLPSSPSVFYEEGAVEGFSPVPSAEGASAVWEHREDVSSLALYEVPFYRVSFRSGACSYSAWVDGVSGRVYLDGAPPAQSDAITGRFLKLALSMLSLFTLEALVVPGFGWGLLVISVSAAAAFLLVRRGADGSAP